MVAQLTSPGAPKGSVLARVATHGGETILQQIDGTRARKHKPRAMIDGTLQRDESQRRHSRTSQLKQGRLLQNVVRKSRKIFNGGGAGRAMIEKFMLKHATLQRGQDCDRSMLLLALESEEGGNAARLKVRRGRRLRLAATMRSADRVSSCRPLSKRRISQQRATTVFHFFTPGHPCSGTVDT